MKWGAAGLVVLGLVLAVIVLWQGRPISQPTHGPPVQAATASNRPDGVTAVSYTEGSGVLTVFFTNRPRRDIADVAPELAREFLASEDRTAFYARTWGPSD